MPSLIAYRKVTDAVTTHTLALPEAPAQGQQGQQSGQEIATITDGRTIVVLFDDHTLPEDQPSAIAPSVQVLTSTQVDELREEICRASPHVRLINERVKQAIAERYDTTDEIKLLRTAPSAEFTAYNAYAEDCRAWGAAEKAKLGL